MNTISNYLNLRKNVDVLYDVQDVRMRTANRLRLMPKDSKIYVAQLLEIEKGLTEEIEVSLLRIPIYAQWLQQVKGVGPRIAGSIIAHTMIRFERVSATEYKRMMSHFSSETQDELASHHTDETQRGYASQSRLETQDEDASQKSGDTQGGLAFTQEQLELAQKTDRGEYLIPVIRGIRAFVTVSKYWAWWGLHVKDGKAPKRSRGERINWNPKLRTLQWKIGKQFVLQGERYREVYDEYKKKLSAVRLPIGVCAQYKECLAKMKKRKKPACVGHIDAMARRYAVKMFLSHLWEKWRTLEGLTVRAPYAIDKLGHTTRTAPEA